MRPIRQQGGMRVRTGLTRPIPAVEKLRSSQAREFKGGLNTFDTPLQMNSRYLIEARNLYPDTNGRLRLRYGTSYFSDISSLTDGEIVNIEYYNAAIIAVTSDGKIFKVLANGDAEVIWDADIAAAKDPPVTEWSTGLTFVSFTQFGGKLVVCNGVDKPLIIDDLFDVNYLIDLGTNSNVNVPRAKFCTTHNNYLVLAGTPAIPEDPPDPAIAADFTTLFIGSKGTAGTFEGDPGIDNDGVNFVTNTYIQRGSPDITGLGSFRDRLIVSFSESLLSIQLGVYNEDGDHTPTVEDVIENHGAISHRTIVALGDDILFMDSAGVASVQRALITATLSPVRESTLVGRDMQAALARFTPAQLDQFVFAVHDRIQQHIFFFIPKSTDVAEDSSVDNDVYVYCFDRGQRFRAWTYFDQMAYRCGCRSAEGRVFLAAGTVIYYYHNQYEPLYNDYAQPGIQSWDSGQMWSDGTGWEETSSAVGTPIPFAFSLPWTDLKAPTQFKQSKYVSVVAEGAGDFTLSMFVDSFPNAELSMTMRQEEYPEGGNSVYRPANNQQLYAWPAKFDRMRLRVSGETDNYLAFVSLQLLYLTGSLRR